MTLFGKLHFRNGKAYAAHAQSLYNEPTLVTNFWRLDATQADCTMRGLKDGQELTWTAGSRFWVAKLDSWNRLCLNTKGEFSEFTESEPIPPPARSKADKRRYESGRWQTYTKKHGWT